MTPNPFGIVRAEFLHGRPRHAIFTVPGGEKASRHPSVEHSIPHVISRVPPRVCVNLSSGYHICSVTPSYATRSVRALLSLSLSSHRLPAPHPHSISPFESRRRPLSLSRPSVRPSVRPRSACDSKPQDTCCIACLLAVHPHADLRPRVHARTRRSLLRVDFCHLRLAFFFFLRN